MKAVFENIVKKTSHPKGIGLAMNFVNPNILPDKQKIPDKPVVFEKPLSSLVYKPSNIIFDNVNSIKHEVELGIIISKKGKNISKQEYKDYIGGYFLLLDLTYATGGVIEEKAPWLLRKGGDDFFVVGDYISPDKVRDPHNLKLELKINGFVAQDGNTKDMIFKIPDQIAYVSKFMTLNEGDLFLTGTPIGIGPIKDQDLLEATLRQEQSILDKIKLSVSLKNNV